MKSKVFWIGKRTGGQRYEAGRIKSSWDEDTGFAKGYLEAFCVNLFEDLGIKLKAGQIKKFRLVEVK